jgi:hypothetical protein
LVLRPYGWTTALPPGVSSMLFSLLSALFPLLLPLCSSLSAPPSLLLPLCSSLSAPQAYKMATDSAEQKLVGDQISAAILANSGKVYTSEPSHQLYFTSGTADDWGYTKAGIKLTYTIFIYCYCSFVSFYFFFSSFPFPALSLSFSFSSPCFFPLSLL